MADPSSRPPASGDAALDALLGRAAELAAGPLHGIEGEAKELATMAGGDLELISRARRLAMDWVEEGGGPVAKQVVAMIRRAIEVGEWDWKTG